jgi:hypothetical protein
MPYGDGRDPGGTAVVNGQSGAGQVMRDSSSIAEPKSVARSRLQNRLGWALVAVLILAQWGMFRQFALRDVVWTYPPNNDQLNYLSWSYTSYEVMLDAGLGKGLQTAAGWVKPPRPPRLHDQAVLPVNPPRPRGMVQGGSAAGMLLPFQATMLYFMLGADRLTALTLNLFYFALFQCMLVVALKWVSGRWSVALVGLGLLLTALTPFFWAGGLMDFRFDLAAFCMLGSFLCVVIRSGVFVDRKWSIVAGVFGATLFLVRFLTIIYLGGILGLLIAFLLVRFYRRRGSADRRQVIGQLRNAFLACGIITLVAVPMIIERLPSIKAYYIVGHVTGKEAAIRAAEQGLTDLSSKLWYYPHSLLTDHAGPLMLWSAAVALTVALLIRLITKRSRQITDRFDLAAAAVLVVAALLVPLAILTTDQSKSPVVAGIMVGPFLWIVLLAFLAIGGFWKGVSMGRVATFLLALLATGSVCAGMAMQSSQYNWRGWSSPQRDLLAPLFDTYDRIGSVASGMGWKYPNMAFNTTSDSLHFQAFQVMEFERRGLWFEPREVLGNTIFHRTAEDAIADLKLADIVVLSDFPPTEGFEHEFEADMRKTLATLMDWCRENLVEISSVPILGRQTTVFIRPAVRVQVDPDGWIASRGMTISGVAEVLRQRPNIELIGPNSATYLPSAPHVRIEMSRPDGSTVQVPATLEYAAPDYHLHVHLDPNTLPASGKVELAVSFDSSFVPRKVNGTADDRELEFALPTGAELRR